MIEGACAVQDVKNLPRRHFLFRRTGSAVAGDWPVEEPSLELDGEISVYIQRQRPAAPRFSTLREFDERDEAGLVIRCCLLTEKATFFGQEIVAELARGEAGRGGGLGPFSVDGDALHLDAGSFHSPTIRMCRNWLAAIVGLSPTVWPNCRPS